MPDFKSIYGDAPTAAAALAPVFDIFGTLRKADEALARENAEQKAVDFGYAHVLYERLMQHVKNFEETLNPDEEIAAYLSSFGSTVLIDIEHVGFHNPFMIVFYGRMIGGDGGRVRLVQHTTQLNVLFTSVKVAKEEDRPARRIGFIQENAATDG